MDKLVPITKAEVIGDHELRLTFADGIIGDIAFDDGEWQGVFEPLRDPRRFEQVSVEYGTIVWSVDGLDMAPEPLYAQVREHQVRSPARMPA
jgi:hypothetical protein